MSKRKNVGIFQYQWEIFYSVNIFILNLFCQNEIHVSNLKLATGFCHVYEIFQTQLESTVSDPVNCIASFVLLSSV
jgi:hypothetical protein